MSRASAARPRDDSKDAPRPPIPNSYWLPDEWIVAGEYPGDEREERARQRLGALLDAGVRTIVDLTAPADGMPPYDAALAEEARQRGVSAARLALPIRDIAVAEPAVMNLILDTIDDHVRAERVVYVHCWGGVGRTGIVVGCHLVRRGATGSEALATVRRLFNTMSPSKVRMHGGQSPQTLDQCEFVLGWAEHDRRLREGR